MAAGRFTQILNAVGSTVEYYSVKSDGTYEEPTNILAVITPARTDELILEPGYVIADYITVYTNVAVKPHDVICWGSMGYLVLTVQPFTLKNEVAYIKAQCRRLNLDAEFDSDDFDSDDFLIIDMTFYSGNG